MGILDGLKNEAQKLETKIEEAVTPQAPVTPENPTEPVVPAVEKVACLNCEGKGFVDEYNNRCVSCNGTGKAN